MAVQTIRGMKWFPTQASNFSNAAPGSISFWVNGAIEMWSDANSLIWYRLGTVNAHNGTVSWGTPTSHVKGITPCVDINDWGVLVEVHTSQDNFGLYIYVGVADFNTLTVEWVYSPAGNYDHGIVPQVAINNQTPPWIVEVHQTDDSAPYNTTLWGHLGTVTTDGVPPVLVDMAPNKHYDDGNSPRVALNDSGDVIEVHVGASTSSLYARVGTITDITTGEMSWTGGLEYDSGSSPSVAINNYGDMIEIHQSDGGDSALYSVYYWVGRPDYANETLSMTVNECLGWGTNPCVAMTSQGLVIFDCQDGDNQDDDSFFYGVGTLENFSYGMAEWLRNVTYDRIIFPGTHNSYSNDSNLDSVLAYHDIDLNNHLSVGQQLTAGIRCVNFEIHPFVSAYEWMAQAATYDAVVYHGSGSVAPVEGVAGCSSLHTLFAEILDWVTANPAEVVTIYCGYESGFTDTQTIVQVLADTGLLESVFNISTQLTDGKVTSYTLDSPASSTLIPGQSSQNVVLIESEMACGENSFDEPGDNCANPQATWNASLVADLAPEALCIPTGASTALFRDSNFCSRRTFNYDYPYTTAGNPFQAGQANQYHVVYSLGSAILSQRQAALTEAGLATGAGFWIWVDFAGNPQPDHYLDSPIPPYGLLAAVYDLNRNWNWTNQYSTEGPTGVTSGAGTVTITDGPIAMARPYAFVIDGGNQLWSNYWTGTAWQWNNQSDATGAPGGVAAGVGVVSVQLIPGEAQAPYAYVVDDTSDADLWVNYWDPIAKGWGWDNLCQNVTTPVPGVILSGIGPYKITDSRGDHPYAGVIDKDGIWVISWAPASWDLVGQPPKASAVSGVGAVPIASYAGGAKRPYLFVVGDDKNLWCVWLDASSSWNWVPPAAGGPQEVVSGIGAFAITTPSGAQAPYAVVTDNNGDLWVYWLNGATWTWTPLNAPEAGVSVVGGVGATTVTDYLGGPDRPYVFVAGSDGCLWVNWSSGSADPIDWQWVNLLGGSVASGVGAIAVAPSAPIGPTWPYAFVVAANGLWLNSYS